MIIATLPYILIFSVWIWLSNLLIRKKDYEHVIARGIFYGLWILAVILVLHYTIPTIELKTILNPRAELGHRIWFLVFIVLNTIAYRQAMKFSITWKSTTMPSMFLAPRKNFIYTKYIEICFQQACFAWIIAWIYTTITTSALHIAAIMAVIMMVVHVPMYWFISKNDATTITVGATIGGGLGTILLLWLYNGFLVTLAIHITFYSVILALLGKYHRELHMLKNEILKV